MVRCEMLYEMHFVSNAFILQHTFSEYARSVINHTFFAITVVENVGLYSEYPKYRRIKTEKRAKMGS